MDAVKYLKEVARMNHKGASGTCGIDCNVCALGRLNNGKDIGCMALEARYPEKAVEIVKKWSEEHTQKTYLIDFLEKYPNCKKCNNGIPESCRDNIYGNQSDCRCESCEKCWNEPMED